MEAAADDLPGVLGVMKQHLEAQNSGKCFGFDVAFFVDGIGGGGVGEWVSSSFLSIKLTGRTHPYNFSQSPSLEADAKSIVERLESLKEKDHTVSITNAGSYALCCPADSD